MPQRYCEKTVVVVVPCAKAKSGIKAFWNTLSTLGRKVRTNIIHNSYNLYNSCGCFFKDEEWPWISNFLEPKLVTIFLTWNDSAPNSIAFWINHDLVN